jgi:membrane protein CcdC involved in cytochrome C biogenesis
VRRLSLHEKLANRAIVARRNQRVASSLVLIGDDWPVIVVPVIMMMVAAMRVVVVMLMNNSSGMGVLMAWMLTVPYRVQAISQYARRPINRQQQPGNPTRSRFLA